MYFWKAKAFHSLQINNKNTDAMGDQCEVLPFHG